MKRSRRIASITVGALSAVTALTLTAVPAQATPDTQGRQTVIVVSPTGDDAGSGTPGHPVKTLQQAQRLVRAAAQTGAVTVELQDGMYRLDKPLTFGSADSGTPDHPIRWEAARGAQPVISGGRSVTGWQAYDASKNIFVASVPKGTDSRQLYVDGKAAPRASITIARSDVTVTTSGMTINNPALSYLASLPNQNRIEVESQDSFTDRYAVVQNITGSTITMQQPGWQNNNWGYDTLAHPFAGGQLMLQNAYAFLQDGQWYLDPTSGQLFYKAPAGTSPATSQVVLPQLQSLVQIAGSYADPVHDISFSGIQFSHSTWLSPSTNIGYADQQNGAFLPQAFPQPADYLTSCQSGCKEFEGARNGWNQTPAAVQVAAATRISFSDDTFAHLGEVGLGIGNDADANASGVGLGVTSTTVHHNLFTDLAGAGVVVGGVQPDAHHPSNPGMAIKDVTIDDNLVTDVAKDYKDMSGILSTYADHTVISHNEVSDLAYDGIDVGWGWGANDPGGSQDYQNRGLYSYQPIYTTPTTLKNTVVTGNRIHGTKKVFHDGGSLYNLSANPGAVFSDNYIYDNLHTVGLYLDEGSRYVSLQSNVVQDSGVWVFTNAYGPNHTADNTIEGTWYNAGVAQLPNAASRNNQLIDNIKVSGTNWPIDAQKVIYDSGIEPGLRTFPGVSATVPVGFALTASAAGVAPGGTVTITATAENFSDSVVKLDGQPTLSVPAGWTATPTGDALPGALPAGRTATLTWTLTAPATASGTVTVTVSGILQAGQGGQSYAPASQVGLQVTNG